eukprot:CAMPEP_0172895568 /NCGR_PEP_ID=MMETSP1075-20121228/153379_1 /TAXON_ID=2916 /ORGANISM="Ceratium fusus, Strain PA161109" /LENGTH=63 /DNA_ID=CAMNT_0013750799 /DNA_START=13 /DNA_END=200 /DNA_ORIENTATION=+
MTPSKPKSMNGFSDRSVAARKCIVMQPCGRPVLSQSSGVTEALVLGPMQITSSTMTPVASPVP